VTTDDSVYSNLASLLTALQSVRPAGHTLDTSQVNDVHSLLIDNRCYFIVNSYCPRRSDGLYCCHRSFLSVSTKTHEPLHAA